MAPHYWHTAYASVIGTSHEKMGARCQDNGACKITKGKNGEEILIAIVSDGAGSACQSEVGSALVVKSFIKEFQTIALRINDVAQIEKTLVLDWLKRVQEELMLLGDNEGLQLKDFACTALGAIVGPNSAIFFQIGDGAIVISEEGIDEYNPMFWPQHGEFANQTNFITQTNAADLLEFVALHQKFDQIALFTDGLERLILDFSDQTVYAPSLKPIFSWLGTIQPCHQDGSSNVITAYLNSELINKRTDDDKTLIMATKRPVKGDRENDQDI